MDDNVKSKGSINPKNTVRFIQHLQESNFYGEVTLKFNNGNIVLVETQQKLKLQDFENQNVMVFREGESQAG